MKSKYEENMKNMKNNKETNNVMWNGIREGKVHLIKKDMSSLPVRVCWMGINYIDSFIKSKTIKSMQKILQ